MQIKSLPRLLFLIAFLSISVFPQTSDELRRKYKLSSVVQGYEVRPGIVALVFFGHTGQAISLSIMPGSFDWERLPRSIITPSVGQELLSELVPVKQRGKLCYDKGDPSGADYYRTIVYENVQIMIAERNHNTSEVNVTQIDVKLWPNVPCPSAPSNNSLDRSGAKNSDK